jgi:hypothetical protein
VEGIGMKKEDLLSVCKLNDWYSSYGSVYFTIILSDKEINFNFTGYSEEDMALISSSLIKKIISELYLLDKEARRIIKNQYEYQDIDALKLSDIIFDKSGCYNNFGIGYYVGESPAGKLYLIIKFDDKFQADNDIVYEVY